MWLTICIFTCMGDSVILYRITLVSVLRLEKFCIGRRMCLYVFTECVCACVFTSVLHFQTPLGEGKTLFVLFEEYTVQNNTTVWIRLQPTSHYPK